MILTVLAILTLLTTTLATKIGSAPYTKIKEYSGSSFFSGFTTFTGPDPTGGYVDYVSLRTAASKNLTAFIFREEANASNAFVGVDFRQLSTSVNASSGRMSVRLLSKATFDVGLLTVVDVVHAPTGPGVWPAVWLLANVTGLDWPSGGELDIMEWVNDDTTNAMTLHSAPGCVVERDAQGYLGKMASTDCNAQEGSLGCSINAPAFVTDGDGKSLSTAGPAFNAQGGGVYVHEWNENGVTEWLFPRHSIPFDLANETPDPSTWTAKPLARWTGSGCRFNQAFRQQQLIINICLCGNWAGEVWQSSGMANRTGVATCDAWVAGHPEAFKEAYFEFASIKMYSSGGASGVAGDKVKRGDERGNEWGVHLGRHPSHNYRYHRHHHHHGHRDLETLQRQAAMWSNLNTTSGPPTASRSEHAAPALPQTTSTIATPSSDAAALDVTVGMTRALLVLMIAVVM